eukprot:GHVL01017593.1.p1 GENE.GHVL01017593.1~~GHVL01017593.1.p1  ORF type:complete len:165 (+),score=26.47 GHVL01017593.1:27-521(+)
MNRVQTIEQRLSSIENSVNMLQRTQASALESISDNLAHLNQVYDRKPTSHHEARDGIDEEPASCAVCTALRVKLIDHIDERIDLSAKSLSGEIKMLLNRVLSFEAWFRDHVTPDVLDIKEAHTRSEALQESQKIAQEELYNTMHRCIILLYHLIRNSKQGHINI